MDLNNNSRIHFGTNLSPILQEKLSECLQSKDVRRELKNNLSKKISDIITYGSDEFELTIKKDVETDKDLLALKHTNPAIIGSRVVKKNKKNNILSVFLSLSERDILMAEKIFNKKDRHCINLKSLLIHANKLKEHNV